MAGKEQEVPKNPDESLDSPRKPIKIIRLKGGFTQGDLRLLGDGNAVRGAIRMMEEMARLALAGEITPDTRPLGAELDLLHQNPVPPLPDKSIN